MFSLADVRLDSLGLVRAPKCYCSIEHCRDVLLVLVVVVRVLSLRQNTRTGNKLPVLTAYVLVQA